MRDTWKYTMVLVGVHKNRGVIMILATGKCSFRN